MANTTSGTVTFDKTFAVDEIIAEVLSKVTVPDVVLAISYLPSIL
jgi:hypothetical protein